MCLDCEHTWNFSWRIVTSLHFDLSRLWILLQKKRQVEGLRDSLDRLDGLSTIWRQAQNMVVECISLLFISLVSKSGPCISPQSRVKHIRKLSFTYKLNNYQKFPPLNQQKQKKNNFGKCWPYKNQTFDTFCPLKRIKSPKCDQFWPLKLNKNHFNKCLPLKHFKN